MLANSESMNQLKNFPLVNSFFRNTRKKKLFTFKVCQIPISKVVFPNTSGSTDSLGAYYLTKHFFLLLCTY